MIKKTYLKSLAVAVLSLGMMAGVAVADKIEGQINFSAHWEPITQDVVDGPAVEAEIGTATGIDWHPGGLLNGLTVAAPEVTGTSGDFDGLLGSTPDFTDFFFEPFQITNPLWTVGGFSFNLTSVSLDRQTDTFLGLYGTGIMFGNNFEETEYNWFFSTQDGLSLSTGNSAVPEPATMLLFGAGLVGLAGVSRSRKKAKK